MNRIGSSAVCGLVICMALLVAVVSTGTEVKFALKPFSTVVGAIRT